MDNKNSVKTSDYLSFFLNRKKIVVITTLLGICLSVVYSLLVTELFESKATVLPYGVAKGPYKALGVPANYMVGFSNNTPSNQVLVLLKSRSIAKKVVDTLDLMPIIFAEYWDDARNQWKEERPPAIPSYQKAYELIHREILTVEASRRLPTITVTALYKSPEIAQKIVSTYLGEANKFLKEISKSSLNQQRVFLEGQLILAEQATLNFAKYMSNFHNRRALGDEQNEIDLSLEQELELFRGLQRLGIVNEERDGSQHATVKQLPLEIYIDYLSQKQKILQNMTLDLSIKYQHALLEEEKNLKGFEVIDFPEVPLERTFPRRTLIVVVSSIISLLLGGILVSVLFFLKNLKRLMELA